MAYHIIKERTENHCVVRTNCYGSTMKFLNELFESAKKDFPELELEDVEVKYYGGERYARTFGLEFTIAKITNKAPLDDYREIHKLEFTK